MGFNEYNVLLGKIHAFGKLSCRGHTVQIKLQCVLFQPFLFLKHIKVYRKDSLSYYIYLMQKIEGKKYPEKHYFFV